MNIKEILESSRIKLIKKSFDKVFYNYVLKRDTALKKIDANSLKNKLKEIKKHSIENLDNLKRIAIKNLRKQKIKVFEAKDAKEAIKIFCKIVPKGEVVVKAKANTINEIGLVEKLKKRNKIIETDCGDFLLQICDEEAIHPITPAIHLKVEEIVKKIREKFGIRVEKKPEKIVEWVRKYLRRKILLAKFGLTGANAISADGAIFILENEGNISLISRLPEKHIIITGIEKIVPSIEDAMLVCKAETIWGVGANLPSYINIISSPSKTADIRDRIVYGMHTTKKVYLILLDNGRSNMIKNGFADLLYCINCGSCLYFCPVYREIFNNYGFSYFGGIGILKLGFIKSFETAFRCGLLFCTCCQACKENCPLEIDIPRGIKRLRKMVVEKRLESEVNYRMKENLKKYGNPLGKIEKGKIPKELFCC